MVTSFLSDADRARIEAAVRKAEARTSAEFVTVIASTSDTYLLMPVLAAATIAFVAPGLVWLSGWLDDFLSLYALQLVVFAALALIFQHRSIAPKLVPASVKRARAAQRARAQFAQRVHATGERHGVLLYVSVAERYVEIIADASVHARAAPGTWTAIVASFTGAVRDGRIADGFEAAINAVADLLATHFPRPPDDRNTLPDRLVELD